jgi:hypothetical protein
MTYPSILPLAIVSVRVEPPERVYVRPQGRLAETFPDAMGDMTHRRMLGTMTVGVTVRLKNMVELDCLPTWVTPAINFSSLLDIPQPPAPRR